VSCGFCDAPIQVGDPLWQIAAPGWTKVRCPRCAGEPVPDVIAHHSPTVELRVQFADRIAALRARSRDWKDAQAGDRR